MKAKLILLQFIVCISILFQSCSNGVDILPEEGGAELESRDSPILNNKVNIVSLSDVCAIESTTRTNTRGIKNSEVMIHAILDENKDTVFFAVDYPEGGWKLYATDKRVPAILAYSTSDTFEKSIEVEGVHMWVETMKDDMNIIKRSKNEELKFTTEEIEQNILFWDMTKNPSKPLSNQSSTRATPPTPILEGHYKLALTNTSYESYDSIPHLIPVAWHQGSPYNRYCPYTTDNSTRAQAGCVAIAGAQMLFYLHDKFENSLTAPSNAYCFGDINNYVMGQNNFNSTIWDYMQANPDKAAPLVANVGFLVGTNYGNNGSGANTLDLADNVFPVYGISCSVDNYNEDIVRNSLTDKMPVIIRAKSNRTPFATGHAFIIDGYRRYSYVTVNTYVWVYDIITQEDGALPLLPYGPEDYTTISYSSPVVQQIRMNWGWGSNNVNDIWFTLMGDWNVSVNHDDYNFTHQRKMLYNFNQIQ